MFKLLHLAIVVIVLSVIYGSFCYIVYSEDSIIAKISISDGTFFEKFTINRFDLHTTRSDSNNSFASTDQSSLNIYFTVKTTPRYYKNRIRPLQMSWFQKVNREMVSYVYT